MRTVSRISIDSVIDKTEQIELAPTRIEFLLFGWEVGSSRLGSESVHTTLVEINGSKQSHIDCKVWQNWFW